MDAQRALAALGHQERAQDRLKSPACAYCRTGSATCYLANKAAGRRVAGKEPSAHDPACPEYGRPRAKAEVEARLFCQRCDLARKGDVLGLFLRGTNPSGGAWPLYCPRCGATTPHHEAPRDVVVAEECLCGACQMRRGFGVAP